MLGKIISFASTVYTAGELLRQLYTYNIDPGHYSGYEIEIIWGEYYGFGNSYYYDMHQTVCTVVYISEKGGYVISNEKSGTQLLSRMFYQKGGK